MQKVLNLSPASIEKVALEPVELLHAGVQHAHLKHIETIH
jgi:hypothetical protein